MERRLFLYQLGLTLSSCAVHPEIPQLSKKQHNSQYSHLSPENPKAIAMWDYSWLTRTYNGGGFENYDKVLDQLILRGYNALRIDCFPQFIAEDDTGHVSEKIFLPKKQSKFTLWGNENSINIQPKKQLINFLQKCKQKNISIVLSSWFSGHGTTKNESFSDVSGLVRAWDQTLELLDQYQLLSDVLYVDLLNEYPLWHGYTWLTKEINALGPQSSKEFDFLNSSGQRQYNQVQIKFYNDFITQVIKKLKEKWPKMKFMTSQTNTLNTPWRDLNVSHFEVLDIHQWMIYNKDFSRATGYFDGIHTLKNDKLFKVTNDKIKDYWFQNRNSLKEWLSKTMISRATVAKDLGIPYGCTEGWGAVMWMDHPDLDWSFIKESGLIAANLGAELGYSFNCSSNFTHPHFEALWQDIDWHKEVTKTIRKI